MTVLAPKKLVPMYAVANQAYGRVLAEHGKRVPESVHQKLKTLRLAQPPRGPRQ